MNIYGIRAVTPVDAVKDTWHELWANGYRLGAILLVAGILGAIIFFKGKKGLAVPCTLGAAWLTWHTFNAFNGYESDKLVAGERTPTGMFDLWFNGGPTGFLVFAVSVVMAVVTFILCKAHKIGAFVAFLAAVSIGAFITLVYSIFVYFHG